MTESNVSKRIFAIYDQRNHIFKINTGLLVVFWTRNTVIVLVERNRGTGLSRKHEPWHKKSALQSTNNIIFKCDFLFEVLRRLLKYYKTFIEVLRRLFEVLRRFQEIAFELQEIAF